MGVLGSHADPEERFDRFLRFGPFGHLVNPLLLKR
jgi:hypothetical protein